MGNRRCIQIEDVLSEKDLMKIVDRCVGASGQLVGGTLRPAFDGVGGFIGDHFRLSLEVQVEDQRRTLPLFVKCLPLQNGRKIGYVREYAFFDREMTVFKLIEQMEAGPKWHQWASTALLCSDSLLVMPDLALEGYATRDPLKTFDLPHIRLTLTSVARFHAGCANLEAKRGLALRRPYSVMEDHGQIIVESNFQDCPWTRTGAKLIADIIQKLTQYKDSKPDLKSEVFKQFLNGFKDPLQNNSLNVILHQDLWVNNIMFKYANGVPTNAILIDFQCARYGPPAFDIALFLYTTTSRSFRQQHMDTIFQHYYKIFTESLSTETKSRLKDLRYDYEELLHWFEVSRRFGMAAALILCPFVLMDPSSAKVLSEPVTFERIIFVDRTPEVLAHAERCPEYARRIVELTEEFVERFLLTSSSTK